MSFKIECRCRAEKKVLGLLDHYYYVIDGAEYHFSKPAIPEGTTKRFHVVYEKELCVNCYRLAIVTFTKMKEDFRLYSMFFPILNCESLCLGFSIQSLCLLAIPFVGSLLLKQLYYWAVILILITLVILLANSKYMFSKTDKFTCKHLRRSTSLPTS